HVAERRRRPGDDLLSLLIEAQDNGQKLSEDELVSSAILLLNAGHEATVHQTGNAVRSILAQGGDPRRFFETPEKNVAAVEECLRYDAPLHMFLRYAYEEIEVSPGIQVKPGEMVALLLGMANHDPLAFA
ncbi:cytochrome P450, partial [Mesorhizobium sp. M2D.F.Ca.ET.223.01.1.1]